MSEAKFTKGEWAILPIEDDKEYIRMRGTVLGGRYKIANVSDLKNHHSDTEWCKSERIESNANAHLIAAAPEMYALLEKLASVEHERGGSLSSNGEFNYKVGESVFKEAESLLLKARGEQ